MSSDEQQAAELESVGLAANTAGDSATAKEKFLAAWRLSPKPKYLLSAANMALKVGAIDEARRYYNELNAMELPPKLKQVVQTKLGDERLATAPPQPPPATSPSSATLELRARAEAARVEGLRLLDLAEVELKELLQREQASKQALADVDAAILEATAVAEAQHDADASASYLY